MVIQKFGWRAHINNAVKSVFLSKAKSGAMRVIGAVICCAVLRHLLPRKLPFLVNLLIIMMFLHISG
jgi:hypothetical protein